MKRYVRNIAVDMIDFEGQEKLNKTTALVVGAGGLGSHTLYHLASYGLKNIILMDDDTVSISNLQRQTLYTEQSVGKLKAFEAKRTLNNYNSEINIIDIPERFKSLEPLLVDFDIDIIFDCSDNFQTRMTISEESQKHGNIPVVFSSVAEFQGWVFPQFYTNENDKKIEDIFQPHENDQNCDSLGVVSPSVSFVSSIQAMEGLKYLLDLHDGENYYLDVNCFLYQVSKMEF